jgi:1-acyl-sn-glycerol-3-phosphate acyltransferase
VKNFGVEDRFYDIGGDSLSLVEMLAHSGQALGVKIPLRVAVEQQTIRALAQVIDGLDRSAPETQSSQSAAPPAAATPHAPPASLRARPRGMGRVLKGHRALIRMLASVRIEGIQHIPRTGPLIVASNHVNWLDFPFLIGMTGDAFGHLPGQMGFAAALRWKKLFHLYYQLVGEPVYFRKGEGELEQLERLSAILRAGGMVAIAPEGTFDRGALIRPKLGVVRLAVEGSAPVLPVVIHGQKGAWRSWSRLRRLKVRIRFGPLIEIAPNAVDQAARRREADRVMEAIAEMLPADYRGVYSHLDPAGDEL